MSHNKDASVLHNKAATEHEASAKHHRKAAECHDQNNVSDAKGSSKNAMDCCNTAHKYSTTACDWSSRTVCYLESYDLETRYTSLFKRFENERLGDLVLAPASQSTYRGCADLKLSFKCKT